MGLFHYFQKKSACPPNRENRASSYVVTTPLALARSQKTQSRSGKNKTYLAGTSYLRKAKATSLNHRVARSIRSMLIDSNELLPSFREQNCSCTHVKRRNPLVILQDDARYPEIMSTYVIGIKRSSLKLELFYFLPIKFRNVRF